MEFNTIRQTHGRATEAHCHSLLPASRSSFRRSKARIKASRSSSAGASDAASARHSDYAIGLSNPKLSTFETRPFVISSRSWTCKKVNLEQAILSRSGLGGRLRSTFSGTSLHVKSAAPIVNLSAENELCRLRCLSTGEESGSSSIEGLDVSALYENWNNFTSAVKSSSLDVLREGERIVEDSSGFISSKGAEISHLLSTKLDDGFQPVRGAIQEDIDRLGRSSAAIVHEGSEALESVLARSEGFLHDAQGSLQFNNSSLSQAYSSSVESLHQAALNFAANAWALSAKFGSSLNHLPDNLVNFDSGAAFRSAEALVSEAGTVVGDQYATLGSAGAATATLATILGTFAILSSKSGQRPLEEIVEGEDLPLRYDPDAIGAFFRKRPGDVISRSLKILVECSSLVVSILADQAAGTRQENEKLRAVQLVDLITRLGPTSIKIGQALSIRPDILPVTYLEELQKLQDRVPPFPNEAAKTLIYQGLGRTADELFSELSESPVAAASLGQVYKGRLRVNGDLVAVKVQRPGVLEGISRDLFLMRTVANTLQRLPNMQNDFVGLLDTWAVRFFDELDYVQEGHNAIQFAENMKALDNVTVPDPYMDYTSRKVLTTEWVDGEKLSETKSENLLQLISTALNCYLAQLLESGFLHADPHPGNLLRTPDGRLCVLDFGLMTQVTEDQRYALIDYISHLVNSDYARVAEDLVNLGFVPPDMEDPEKTAAVVPQLSRVLGQLVKGGGVRKINVQQIYDDLANMAKDYVFVLPPYFALILRAFSVLEGIGLEADPDYTIVNECYPYISKRLLTDDSPRTRAALKDFLYGGKGQLDIGRVESMVNGFQSFRAVMEPTGERRKTKKKSQILDPASKEALMVVFAPEGSYIQELLLTELVRSVDALSREALAELWRFVSSTLRIPGLPIPSTLLAPGSWPLPIPGLFFGMGRVARLSEEDERSLDTVKRLMKLFQSNVSFPESGGFFDFLQESASLFFNLLPGVSTAYRRFNVMLLQRLALRFADDLDGTNSVLEWNKDPMLYARHVQPRWLFPFPFQSSGGNVGDDEKSSSRYR